MVRRRGTGRCIAGLKGSVFARNVKQSWVELDERIFHRGVLPVTGLANGAVRDHACCGSRMSRLLLKTEESPLVRVFRRVLDFRLNRDSVALEMSADVNGAMAQGLSNFQHEHGFLRPVAALEEFAIGAGRDKNVIKGWVGLRFRAVRHAQSGAQVDPLAIIWAQQLAVGVEL